MKTLNDERRREIPAAPFETSAGAESASPAELPEVLSTATNGRGKKPCRLMRKPLFWAVIMLLAGALLYFAAAANPGFAAWYSREIYPVLGGAFGSISGFFPVSLAEIAIGAGIFLLFFWPIRAALAAKRGETSAKRAVFSVFSKIAAVLSAVFLLFVVFGGVNYYRPAFAETVGLETKKAPAAELYALCEELLGRANALSTELEHNEHGETVFPESDLEMARKAREGFGKFAEGYDFLQMGGKTFGRPKPVTCSFVMSYLQISGVFSPYTMEANVCAEGPDFLRGATMMHEQVHLRGFMVEAEANFMAFLACQSSGDPYFEYSGASLALLYSMNALYRADYELWMKLRVQYSPSLAADMAAQNAYIAAHETKVAEVSEKVNDTYLKMNKQQDGVKSYGKMVDLLLAERRQNGGFLFG